MKKPKGILIAIGGNVQKGSEKDLRSKRRNKVYAAKVPILSRITREMKGLRMEIITAASGQPEEVGELYRRAFGKLGCQVDVMHIKKRREANSEEYKRRILCADGVFFTGGSQRRLTRILLATPLFGILKSRYMNEKIVIAGTSAGAAAMSEIMIYFGSSKKALLKGKIRITTGFAFLPNVIFDSHFVQRRRYGRLIQAAALHSGHLGIGLQEDAAVVIKRGNLLEVVGSGPVILCDGRTIAKSNISSLQEGEYFSVEGMTLHVLTCGDKFIIEKRKFISKKF